MRLSRLVNSLMISEVRRDAGSMCPLSLSLCVATGSRQDRLGWGDNRACKVSSNDLYSSSSLPSDNGLFAYKSGSSESLFEPWVYYGRLRMIQFTLMPSLSSTGCQWIRSAGYVLWRMRFVNTFSISKHHRLADSRAKDRGRMKIGGYNPAIYLKMLLVL